MAPKKMNRREKMMITVRKINFTRELWGITSKKSG